MNSVIEIMIIVEGRTEEEFVRNVLAEYFFDQNIYLSHAGRRRYPPCVIGGITQKVFPHRPILPMGQIVAILREGIKGILGIEGTANLIMRT